MTKANKAATGRTLKRRNKMGDTLFLVLFWTGPIGIGVFLVCLGAMIYFLAQADAVTKRTRREEKEKK